MNMKLNFFSSKRPI